MEEIPDAMQMIQKNALGEIDIEISEYAELLHKTIPILSKLNLVKNLSEMTDLQIAIGRELKRRLGVE